MSERTKSDNRQQEDENDQNNYSTPSKSRRRRSKTRYSVRKERIYDKIKRPRTPYTFFVMDDEQRKKAEKRAGRDGDIRMALADIWNNMSDKEKEEFERRFEDDIKRYEDECDEIDEQRRGKSNYKRSSPRDERDGGSKRRRRVNRKQNQKGSGDPNEYDDYGESDGN